MKKTILFCVALAGLTAMSSCGNKAATKLENAADSASYALGVSNGARFGEALKSGMYEQLKNIDPNDFMKGLAAALKTDSTQRSYEMGLSQGLYIKEMLNNIKQGTGVEIDIPTFVQAYKQAMDGDTTLLFKNNIFELSYYVKDNYSVSFTNMYTSRVTYGKLGSSL